MASDVSASYQHCRNLARTAARNFYYGFALLPPAKRDALCALYAFGLTFVTFKVVNAVKSMRVSEEVELEGLDVPEFGGLAYPDDAVASTPATAPGGAYLST